MIFYLHFTCRKTNVSKINCLVNVNNNIINFVWFTRSIRISRGMEKSKETRRFLMYSLYAWGVPSISATLTVLVDHFQLVPEIWSPQMGIKNVCWFGRK